MMLIKDAHKDGEYTNHLHGDLPNVFRWQDVDVERTRIELDRAKQHIIRVRGDRTQYQVCVSHCRQTVPGFRV